MKTLLAVLRELPVHDCNAEYTYLSHYRSPKSLSSAYQKAIIATLRQPLRAITAFSRQLRFIKSSRINRSIDVLFVYGTLNQYRAISQVRGELGQSDLAVEAYAVNKPRSEEDGLFHIWLAHLLGFFFLPVAWWIFLRADRATKLRMSARLDVYALMFAWAIVARWQLKRFKVRCVVVSNDHGFWYRLLAYIAPTVGCQTVYIQHANVSEEFPPVVFSYGFLDGQDSIEKYLNAGTKRGTLLAIGSTRLPNREAFAARGNGLTVGICYNMLDSAEEICELVGGLLRACSDDTRIFVRPHPRDSRTDILGDISDSRVVFSDAKSQLPADFLRECHFCISGNSSIVIEAAWLGCQPIVYGPFGGAEDVYGFLRYPFINRADDVAGIFGLLKVGSEAIPAEQLRPFHELAGTVWEDKVPLLMAQCIESIATGEGPTVLGFTEESDGVLRLPH